MNDKARTIHFDYKHSAFLTPVWTMLYLGFSSMAFSYSKFSTEFSVIDIFAFIFAFILLSGVGLITYYITIRFLNLHILSKVIFSVTLTAIFWSVALVLVENSDWSRFLILCLSAVYFLGYSFYLLGDSISTKRALIITVIFVALPNLLLIAYGKKDFGSKMPDYMESVPNISIISFKQKPDIYLIGFLGASPDKVLQKSLGLQRSELLRTMDTLKFRRFDGVFSEAATTRKSYDLLLGMTREYVEGLSELSLGGQFSGNIYSPIFNIFKNNGYEIITVTEDHKFGFGKGPFVDQYLISEELSFCDRKDYFEQAIRPFIFFGGCNIRLSKFFSGAKSEPAARLLIESIKSTSPQSKPRLTVAHLKPPFHAPKQDKLMSIPGLFEDFVAEYYSGDRVAAAHLEEITRAITSTNRDVIVFVFGDRGIGLIHRIEGAPEFNYMIQDRFEVIAGIYPFDKCAQQFIVAPITTTPSIIRSLLICLAGRDAWPANYEHKIIYEGTLLDPRQISNRSFNEFKINRFDEKRNLHIDSLEE